MASYPKAADGSRVHLNGYWGLVTVQVHDKSGPALTYQQFLGLRYGQVLYSRFHLDSKGRPVRVRVSGKVCTFKDASRNHVPVKYGLYDSFYILSNSQLHYWSLEEKEG